MLFALSQISFLQEFVTSELPSQKQGGPVRDGRKEEEEEKEEPVGQFSFVSWCLRSPSYLRVCRVVSRVSHRLLGLLSSFLSLSLPLSIIISSGGRERLGGGGGGGRLRVRREGREEKKEEKTRTTTHDAQLRDVTE